MFSYPIVSYPAIKSISESFIINSGVNLPGFLLNLLHNPAYKDDQCTLDIIKNARGIVDGFNLHMPSRELLLAWAHTVVKKAYSAEIKELIGNEEWHFNAGQTLASQIQEFRIEDLAAKMQKLAPELWGILDLLLMGERKLANDTLDAMDVDTPEDLEGGTARTEHDKSSALCTIKKVVMISIMMQNRNAKCNALESVFGIFLHSTCTPEKVISALAHMGISISGSAILAAVKSLSEETRDTLREMGQTLLVGYAYDNFDANFKVLVPTIEKSGDTLTHLTSGCLIMLEHGVTQEDLKCSEELWTKSTLNPKNKNTNLPETCSDLVMLHPETDHPSGLVRRQCYNAWKFREDLFKYGPEYFREFKNDTPEVIDGIPVVKMRYAPARAMDHNESTYAGNISVINDLLAQGGVADPETLTDTQRKFVKNISLIKYVVLFFGDLATFERVAGVLRRRCIEANPYRRFQFVVFVMGLFHLKMAAADALWRLFIEPKTSRQDPNSLMSFVAKLRPRETGKIGSGPGFRQMHEVILYSSTALRLDAWATEIKVRAGQKALEDAEKLLATGKVKTLDEALKAQPPGLASLEEYATACPTQDEIFKFSEHLACHYVAGGEFVDIFSLRKRSPSGKPRDAQRENIVLMHQYFLLYEEMSYAMNQGDIGRVETLFPAWISIFRGVGKHKYAAHMSHFLTELHFVYPPQLRHAIRYNILVNPTGKPGAFRGVDWVEESMINLFTKVTYGGAGSNYTKERVIRESPLIQIFRSCHENIERNFVVTSTLGRKHAPPDLKLTLKRTTDYMAEKKVNFYSPGRVAVFTVKNALDLGQHLVFNLGDVPDVDGEEQIDQAITDEDLEVEND
ncbi:hypothetical protein D9619_013000 [Psilocybe cf. subviscida]|uniref:DUF6589 domain-containing protein n=1 Tax=Psilocybe cf. subviscida TaxID=2480587 RepID=A0A8H5B182_9AGAR|nr:hypothetical protein D9619_013000 [Psilocybe cf. subviscida]